MSTLHLVGFGPDHPDQTRALARTLQAADTLVLLDDGLLWKQLPWSVEHVLRVKADDEAAWQALAALTESHARILNWWSSPPAP